jgi:hypothetical protein
MTSTINMTPDDRLEFEKAIRNASEILYRYSNTQSCQSFEHLEDNLRHQILEFVAPQITLFLSKR